MRRRRRPQQTEFHFPTWGGRRPRAGRKPRGEKAGLPHRPRPDFSRNLPLHVTLRVLPHVYQLRSQRCYAVVWRSLKRRGQRFGLRVIEYSVQGNHLHLLVEAEHRRSLARGIKGLAVSIAKGLNRLMARKGVVFADRYHARILRTPRATRNALHYVRENARQHAAQWGQRLPASWTDPYSSRATHPRWGPPPVHPPRSWLLRAGWRRAPRARAPTPDSR